MMGQAGREIIPMSSDSPALREDKHIQTVDSANNRDSDQVQNIVKIWPHSRFSSTDSNGVSQ